MKVIGRDEQIAEINSLYNSGKSELLAIYGRRRVGKTFLVDQTLKGKISFRHAGLSPIEANQNRNSNNKSEDKKTGSLMKMQLEHFFNSLKRYGYKGKKQPKTWLEAFYMLEQLLTAIDTGERQVVFLDELPWMDTTRSRFITAFEGFWNTWGCCRDNLMVVICASANSWILDNMINSRGGLYGRTTYEIHLSPLTLAQCREFYRSRNIEMSDYDIVQSYMTFGGIPFYMGYVKREKSIAQNIDDLFWGKDARLKNEFERLFNSAFDSPESIKKIVIFIGSRHKGYTRQEIIKGTGEKDGGDFSKRLKALISSDFITDYIPFGCGKKEVHYKLSDPFCLFYLHFVQGRTDSSNFWLNTFNSHQVINWRGIAFEEVCFNHIPQIKHALGISGVLSTESNWIVPGGEEKGTQIDLLIYRKDNVVNMCEIKFYSDEFTVEKDYDKIIRHRMKILSDYLPKRVAIHPTIITTFGVTEGKYATVFVKGLTLEDLFVFENNTVKLKEFKQLK